MNIEEIYDFLKLTIENSIYDKFTQNKDLQIEKFLNTLERGYVSRRIIFNQLKKQNDYLNNEKLKVAYLSIITKNQTLLIQKLQQRGAAIKNDDQVNLAKIQDEIKEIQESLKSELKIPTQCFVTFEYEYGLETFQKEFNLQKAAGEETEITKYFKKVSIAHEPSDVIYESLDVQESEQEKKIWSFNLIIIIFMGFVFVLMILMFGYTSSISMKYPKSFDCQRFVEKFQSIEDEVDKQETFKQYALIDIDHAKIRKGMGYYQCYCKIYSTDSEDQDTHDKFCYEYNYENQLSLYLGILASVLLNIVNFFLEMINKYFIDRIGYKSKSSRDSVILLKNFISQFFNTGIILLLCNANTTYSILSFIPLNNSYVDISYHWYTHTGTSIVIVMIICAISPYIEFLIEFLLV